jgi:hypothetical protein
MVGCLLQIWRVWLGINAWGMAIEDLESMSDDNFNEWQKTLTRQQLAMVLRVLPT